MFQKQRQSKESHCLIKPPLFYHICVWCCLTIHIVLLGYGCMDYYILRYCFLVPNVLWFDFHGF
jgi:hypothetical protein